MKNLNFAAQIVILNLTVVTLFLGLQTTASAQLKPIKEPKIIAKKVDISCRPALYFGGEIGSGVSPNKNSKQVLAGGKIELNKADSFSQSGGKYAFNLQYFIFGSPEKQIIKAGEFSNRIKLGAEILNQNTVKFSEANSGNNDTKILVIQTQIYLPVGENTILLSLDDDKKIGESNEGNNQHRFIVVVKE